MAPIETRTTADGSLIVSYEATTFPKFLFAAGLVFAATAVYDVTIGWRGTGRMVGLIGAIAVCVGSALVSFERSEFIFDSRARQVRWRRQWAWSRRAGTLPFDRVRSVIAQTMGETREYPDRRLCLQPIDGPLVPLTAAYAPDPRGELVRIADEIRTMIDASPATADESLAALVREGRTMDAIRLLREQGLSLSEAKRRLDDLR